MDEGVGGNPSFMSAVTIIVIVAAVLLCS